MNRHATAAAVLAILAALLAGAAPAVERFALPQFKSGYVRPATEVPAPRADLYDWLDVSALAAALAAASYLAIRARSRRGLWWLAVMSLAYFGFWRGGCACAVGATQNVALALGGGGYAVPAAVALFFILPLAATLFFGRTFCAGVCPLGALQELVVVRPLRVPAWLEHSLGLLAYIYLGAAVLFAATGSAFVICEYDPFVSIFRLAPLGRPASTMNALGGSTGMLVLGAAFLAAGLFIGRPYCRWLCPYGAILRLLGRVSRWRVTITPEECIKCRLCEDACPFGAIRRPTGDWPRGERLIERRRLAVLLVIAAALLAAGAGLGWRLVGPMSRMHHTVRQADRVRLEETGQVEGTVDLSDAFYATHRPPAELYAEAAAVEASFARASPLFGAWVGLVLGAKLIQLSVRRTRTDYEPDRAACVSCGRCFAYCPIERERWKKASGGTNAS
ncbi:MAG: 4Fe-4S binding protein [Planctomycetes bacterium]|nr:4Fe-4S binding protein [Planctomycetota bacterium]